METRNVSVKEALSIAADNLGNIQLPVALLDSIGAPISEARKIILMCIEHIKDEPATESPAEEAPEE